MVLRFGIFVNVLRDTEAISEWSDNQIHTIKLLPFRRAWSAEYAASSSGKSQHDPSPCKGYHEISYDSINYYSTMESNYIICFL